MLVSYNYLCVEFHDFQKCVKSKPHGVDLIISCFPPSFTCNGLVEKADTKQKM